MNIWANVPSQRFSVQAEHLPVRPFIEKLAKLMHKNIIITNTVSGDISLHLHDVTWQQAMQSVLQTLHLVSEQQGDISIIMPKNDYEQQRQADLQFSKNIEALAPLQTKLLVVHYANAEALAELLNRKSDSFLSKRGRVSFDKRTNIVVIKDVPSKLKPIVRLLKQLDVPIQQILVKARIVNIDRKNEEELGVRFGLSRPQHLSGNISGHLNFDMPATSLFNHPGQLGLSIAKIAPGVMVDLELSALEKQHLLNVVASPHLIASHAQEAIIESGTEIPYQEQTEGGATSATFKKAVMRLSVKPQITEHDNVLLTLSLNQDKPGELTNNGIAINTEHMQTQLMVKNKQTIVVGGIYETTKQNTVDRVPFFSALPLVGHFFMHKVRVNNTHELLIFITPEIIST